MTNLQFAQKAVVTSGDRILLVRKSVDDPNSPGLWDLPGGRMKDSEDVDEHLAREVLEETGFVVTTGRPIDIWVPWQLYLIAAASICSPMSIVLVPDIRASLLDCIQAVGTSKGYVYPAFGPMKSTRTYGILMDTLWRVRKELGSSRYLTKLSSAANVGTRIIYLRALAGMSLVGALALAGIAVHDWITGGTAPWGALGPELAGGVLLALISLLLNRVRARRR